MPKGGKRAGAGRVPSLFRVLNSEDTKDARRWFAALTAEERGEIILKLFKGEESMEILSCNCGYSASCLENIDNGGYRVMCDRDECENKKGPLAQDVNDAITAWNNQQRIANCRDVLADAGLGDDYSEVVALALCKLGFDSGGEPL